MSDLISVFGNIANAMGVTAALVVFWLYTRVQDCHKRIQRLEQESDLLKQTLSDIRADVAYIKGKLEE